MKTTTILIFAFLSCFIVKAQKATNLTQLLERLENHGNLPIQEPADLFSPSEKLVLQDYFSELYGTNTQSTTSAPGDVYAYDVRTTGDFGTFPVGGPYTISAISTLTDDIFAGDFDDNLDLYALDNGTQSLVTIDKTTGAITTIGPLTNLVAGHNVTGLAWNQANSTMYASSTDGSVSTIYTIDLSTGTLTVIGDTGNPVGIWLAIDSNGNAFMADITDDNLYSIDLSTGAGTLIGSLGIDISFAQAADFDTGTGNLYMAAYIGGGVNIFSLVDTSTGTAAPLGPVNSDDAEVTLAAIEATLGVNENKFNQNIALFPNPASDKLNISNASNTQLKKLSVFDLDGKLVKETELGNKTEQINISDLSPGIYLIEISGKSVKTVKKLIVK